MQNSRYILWKSFYYRSWWVEHCEVVHVFRDMAATRASMSGAVGRVAGNFGGLRRAMDSFVFFHGELFERRLSEMFPPLSWRERLKPRLDLKKWWFELRTGTLYGWPPKQKR